MVVRTRARTRVAAGLVVLVLVAGVVALAAPPAGAAVVMTATPNTGLTGVTVIDVSVTGLAPGANVGLGYCNDTEDTCQIGPLQNADGSGTFGAIAVATPILIGFNGSQADCRVVSCKVVLVDFNEYATAASVPVTFTADADPTVPPPTVTPSSDLQDGQMVTIDAPAGNFFPGLPLSFMQCGYEIELNFLCPWAQGTSSSLVDGTVHVTLEVSRFLYMLEQPGPVDCAALPCYVALYSDIFPAIGFSQPIGFAPAPPPGAAYGAAVPTRILDSRTPVGWTGPLAGPLSAGTPKPLTVASLGGPVAPLAQAAVLNVTVTNPTADSFLTVWANGLEQPPTSNLNFAAGQTVANLVTVPLGADGAVQIANAVGTVDVVVDVVGSYAFAMHGPSWFIPVAPDRLLDTRTTTGGWAHQLESGAQRDLKVTGVGGVIDGASNVIVNITATNATHGSYLTVWASGATEPTTSTLNFGPGQTVAHLAIVPVGANGKITFANAIGGVDVVVDVVGFFHPVTGAKFHMLGLPSRILDGRVDVGLSGPWNAMQTRTLDVAGQGGIPDDATGVVMNTTVTNGTSPSFISVYPSGTTPPGTSSLNFAAGETVPNAVISGLLANGQLDIFNQQGSVDIVGDVAGYFSAV